MVVKGDVGKDVGVLVTMVMVVVMSNGDPSSN